MQAVKVIQAGLSTTIQDSGRLGYQGDGFLNSGVMDPYAYQLGNALVGNARELDAASLEFTLTGGQLAFQAITVVAVTGASSRVRLNDEVVAENEPLLVTAGDFLAIDQVTDGRFVYLSVAGGFQVPRVKGSRATATAIGIGGLDGRRLASGDLLPVLPLNEVDLPRPVPTQPLDEGELMAPQRPDHIRVVPGAQSDWFDENARQTFFESDYQLSKDINRMGFRLQGPEIKAQGDNLLSEANLNGAIQIGRSGSPIALLADRATHGGYPVIAKVIAADLGWLAQWPSGQPLRFAEVDLTTAWDLLADQRDYLQAVYLSQPWQNLLPVRPVAARVATLFQ
ncbi:biotin-dependent carboxyltransferase family protein [Leuconostocaceae bacterium ESL0723]|nr:biotin-dependent carboxyltransferase family protein [Leuconostocaceae bacterium ESL0723]